MLYQTTGSEQGLSVSPSSCQQPERAAPLPPADSEIVVMTTEILRNIMYRIQDASRNPEREDRLADVGLVVLDEVKAPHTEP